MSSFVFLIVSNLFVACLIACLAFAVGRSGRQSTVAHLLWLAVFIKLVTPPIILAPVPVAQRWADSPAAAADLVSPADDNELANTTASARLEPSAVTAGLLDSETAWNGRSSIGAVVRTFSELTATRTLLLIWIVGTFFFIVRGALRFVRFSRLLQRESVVDHEATTVVKELLSGEQQPPGKVTDKFAPEVRLISARVSPMLFGIGSKTCIICPSRLWQTLSDTQRRAFLAHESAHFLRRDHWVRWIEWLVTAIYWWFPLIIIARQQLERHEEAACDAWAVSRLGTAPRVYAEALLTVVDYLSETRVGVPRLAIRMQPTDTLEERLRLIMSPQRVRLSTFTTSSVGILCGLLLLIHPTPARVTNAASLANSPQPLESLISGLPSERDFAGAADEVAAAKEKTGAMAALPPVPSGWWNAAPTRTWADLRWEERHVRMFAEAGVGFTVEGPDGVTQTFDPESVRALAFVPSTGRLIIGNAEGEIHLWDVKSAQAVSLIGKHQSPISSLAFHSKSGLVSGDQDGNLITWDIQSGQMLGSASVPGPVASVRWSIAGDEIAVIASDWASPSDKTTLHMFRGRSLSAAHSLAIPLTIALVQQHPRFGWLALQWSGTALHMETGRVIDTVPKEMVSGMVLCQDLFSIADHTPSGGDRGEDVVK
jgi:bla regulator protein blaR1